MDVGFGRVKRLLRRAQCTRCRDTYSTSDARFPFVCSDCRKRAEMAPPRTGVADAFREAREQSKRDADALWERLTSETA